MKNKPIKIVSETIHPGEQLSLALPLPELYSCAPLYMPIKVIHGKHAGPTLLITAGMYGNELNGTEIINRLMSMSALKRLRGTLIAVPVLNVYGLINRSRTLPGGASLDRSFPGKPHGSHAARLAHLFTETVFNQADVCVDLQTGEINHSSLPQIYTMLADDKCKSLATAFNAPVIANAHIEKGSIRELAKKLEKPMLMYKAGEAMRFDEQAIKIGLKGILSVIKHLDMLSEDNATKKPVKSFFVDNDVWIRSPTSGVTHSKLMLGHHVKQGDVLCEIKDPFGASNATLVKSSKEGVIVGKNNLPLVNEGEALFQLATFIKMEQAVEHLENWKEDNKQKKT